MLHPPHRLDLRASHVRFALRACASPPAPEAVERRIEEAAGDDAVVVFSVRSAFDALLAALALPAGSEVLMSAVTHPDMVSVVQRRGLVAVPVDIDPADLAMRAASLDRARSAKSRMLVVAHLFGGRADLDRAVAFADQNGLVLVEDCAQSVRGPHDRGDPRAAVSLFSFGSIKTETALGGALVYVRDPETRERMRDIQATWPRQSIGTYLGRVLRFGALAGLGQPRVYDAFTRGGSFVGLDIHSVLGRSIRTLRSSPDDGGDPFGRWLHTRPSAPLLALLERRLRTFDRDRLRRRAERGERAAAALGATLELAGRDASDRTHWVFPVLASSPAAFVARLRAAGFDAAKATTSIDAVPAPTGRPELEPVDATRLMHGVVFVPMYPEVPEPDFRRLLDALAV